MKTEKAERCDPMAVLSLLDGIDTDVEDDDALVWMANTRGGWWHCEAWGVQHGRHRFRAARWWYRTEADAVAAGERGKALVAARPGSVADALQGWMAEGCRREVAAAEVTARVVEVGEQVALAMKEQS